MTFYTVPLILIFLSILNVQSIANWCELAGRKKVKESGFGVADIVNFYKIISVFTKSYSVSEIESGGRFYSGIWEDIASAKG
jgi:hypothetical protein